MIQTPNEYSDVQGIVRPEGPGFNRAIKTRAAGPTSLPKAGVQAKPQRQTCLLPPHPCSIGKPTLPNQMRRSQPHKLSRRNHLRTLPERRKMLLIPCNQIVRASRVGTLQKHIVIRVAANIEPSCRRHNIAAVLNKLHQLQPHTLANPKRRPRQHIAILFQNRGRHIQPSRLRKCQQQSSPLQARRFQRR